MRKLIKKIPEHVKIWDMDTSQEEKELLKKIIQRDEKALFYVYKKYQPSIFNFVKSQINN